MIILKQNRLIKIGLIQMRCEKGAMVENLDRLSRYFYEAVAQDLDVIGFPEMSITGYVDPTRYPGAILALDGPQVAQVLDMTKGQPTTLLAGLVETNPQGKPFITQIAVRDGELLGFYRKITIEDEEVEWFAPGDKVPVFRHGDLTFGMAIPPLVTSCPDLGDKCHYHNLQIRTMIIKISTLSRLSPTRQGKL
jgi:predicted amidohydrolase